MSLGEPICFTGLSDGAIITSTQGFYGFSECINGSDVAPMPLLSYGLSFRETFLYAFRNSSSYDPTGISIDQGWIHVVNGALTSQVSLCDGNGIAVQGQENITVAPWGYLRLFTDGDKEYILKSSNNIMAAINAGMDNNPTGVFRDSRLIMPLTNDGITWPRKGNVSAPYNNTDVKYYTRDNAEGVFTVSPAAPVDFDAATGATDSDYEPDGATRVMATGLISAYSGADSSGLEATPLMPTSAMSQVIAQPLFIADTGDGGNSGVAIASPFAGTAKIYAWNDTLKTAELKYTLPLSRNGVTVTSKEDQYHPTSGAVTNEALGGVVQLEGQLDAGVIISDVPITVVIQNGDGSLAPTIRSQNNTTTTSIINNSDETLTLGVTPTLRKAELILGSDDVYYKRVVDGTGDSWVEA
jgi:hypothetical protein